MQCRVASKECVSRRQGSTIDPSEPSGESYVEALKARIAFLKLRIDEDIRTPESNPEGATLTGSIATPTQRQTPREPHNDMHSTMQEASYLSLSAMAERTDKTRSVHGGLSFRLLLNADIRGRRGELHAIDNRSDSPTRSFISVDRFLCGGNTSAPYQAYLQHICTAYPYLETTRLERAYQYVTHQHSKGLVSIRESTSPDQYVIIYLSLATGILLSPGYERHQQTAEDLVETSLDAFNYVLDVGDDLAAVLCLIALTICSLFLDKVGSTWHQLGLAMTRGVACGLHTAKASQSDAQDNPTEYARAFWALFLLDTYVSSALDRPFYLEDTAVTMSEHSSTEEDWQLLLIEARMVRSNRQTEEEEIVADFINLSCLHETMASRRPIETMDNATKQASAVVELCKYSITKSRPISSMIVSKIAVRFNNFLAALEDQLISRARAPTSLNGLLVFAIGVIMCRLPSIEQTAKQQTTYQAINILTLLSTRFSYARGLRDILMELMMTAVGAELHQPSARLRELIYKLDIQLPSRIEMMILGKGPL